LALITLAHTGEIWKKAFKKVHLSLHLSHDTSGPFGSSSILPRNCVLVARRGNPQVIYSDNGKNFVGADQELKECIENWNQCQITNKFSQKGIKWVFNPPASPHMGGASERLVRLCKTTFKAVLKKQVLTDEVLATTMAEVESLVNSRPLTEVSSDVDAMEAITPNHFLLGCSSINLSPGVFVDKEISSYKR
jgi:transposase InsO family protein